MVGGIILSRFGSACAVHSLYRNADHDRCDVPSIVGCVYVSAQFAFTLCLPNAFLNPVLIRSAPFGHDVGHKFTVSSATLSLHRDAWRAKAAPAKSKKSKLAHRKVSDATPRLNARQAAYLEGLAELKTKKQAAFGRWGLFLLAHAFDSLIV
jgi:hypothetical protein